MLRDYTAAMRALSAVTTFAVVVVAIPLTGCGIKGPLTLPPAPAAPTAGAPAAPAGSPPPTPAASGEAAPATPPAAPAAKP